MSSSELYTKAARVWIPDSDQVWRAAQLLEDYTGQKTLRVQFEDEPEEATINVTEKTLPHLRNPDILIGENDLTSLSYLNEPEVLYNLKVRFAEQNMIYTYCGIVLVAINPYEYLDIYNNDIIQAYSGQDIGAMDPHIFAVSEEAYKQMSRFDRNQSIIVSGESGAGKTVSAKFAMRYFATVGGSQAETQVERRVLASNPIMEAIGNAKTTRNDNSSRFGKYIEINFSRQHSIVGAHMRTYLLEKSRVVFQASEERNYHIFYQLCASAHLPEFKEFQLGDPDDFFYISQGAAPEIPNVNDQEELSRTREAFKTLGFGGQDQMLIFRILSAILHFGNVTIKEKDGESCEVPSKDTSMGTACQLLGVEESQMRLWLCNRKIQTINETLIKPLTCSQASFARDALVKTIYSRLFEWIVTQINKALHTSGKTHKFIGVLDIYGFETFEVNSFEQFCINYANEKLQQLFNMHVFKLEQEEYVREQIEWSFIDFSDNQPCIDLIESKLGVLDLLDDECKMPRGSDTSWCQKLYEKHLNKSPHFEKPKLSRSAFIIIHFADKVQYQSDGFLEKNRDTVFEEQINTLKASQYELVAALFMEEAESSSNSAGAGKRGRSSSIVQPLKVIPKAGNKQNKKTVGSQFRDSLCALMDTLNATTPHYIRCIKPNDAKDAFVFEPKRAVEQLRACGVLETIRISAAGYPSRWTYPEFFQRYQVLTRLKEISFSDLRKTCQVILSTLISDEDKYRFGKTKIFFRAGQVAYLEKLRTSKLRACGIMIQKHWRGWLQRRKYQQISRVARLIQRLGRGVLARRHALYLRQTRAAVKIQAVWRSHCQRKKYTSIHSAVVTLQAHIRALFARKHYSHLLEEQKAVLLQKNIRSFVQRCRFQCLIRGIILTQSHFRRRKAKLELKILKTEAKSVDHIKQVNKGLENKIIELQQRLDEKAKQAVQAQMVETEMLKLKVEVDRLKSMESSVKTTSNKVVDLESELVRLKEELDKLHEEKKDWVSEKDQMRQQHEKIINSNTEEKLSLMKELEEAKATIKQLEEKTEGYATEKTEESSKLLLQEFESERAHHQKLVSDHTRLQQRLKNLQEEMQVLMGKSKGHRHTSSDTSMLSLDSDNSSQVDADSREEQKPEDEMELVFKLRSRVQSLEKDKSKLRAQLEQMLEQPGGHHSFVPDSAFYALRMQDLESENDKLKREVSKLMKSITESSDFLSSNSLSKNEVSKVSKASTEFFAQFEAMTDELQRRREECIQLKTMLADKSITTHSIARESYGGNDTLVNEDNELELAYKTQKELNRLLQNQLNKTESELKKFQRELNADLAELRLENQKQKQMIAQIVSLAPEEQVELIFQNEISKIMSENMDLRQSVDRQADQIYKLKKLLAFYSKKLKSRDAAEMAAELEKDESNTSSDNLVSVIQRERTYMGMLEYKKEDQKTLLDNLIVGLKTKVAVNLRPVGLPAYIIFMCARHIDYINDDEKIKIFLQGVTTRMRKVIKNQDDLEHLVFCVSYTCRLLHTFKQYSGESQFQTSNTPQQNEHSLKNFDLSEYRQVFSDIAVETYQALVRLMQEHMHSLIVAAILEHDSIPGMGSTKPAAFRGRSSSIVKELEDRPSEKPMDALLEELNGNLKLLKLYAIDQEVVKQIFRQMFYCLCTNSLNNLLLRKDMCNWSKGMQIRFNLTHLEQWLRDNSLLDAGAWEALEPLVQASQLLQARKTESDVDSVCDMCNALTTPQIVKILNIYTPVDTFEERVSPAFIKKIQTKLKQTQRKITQNTLLMDTKLIYPVTFPFNPSSVALETVSVPVELNLPFLIRH